VSTMDRRGVLRLFGAVAAAGLTGAAGACATDATGGPAVPVPNGKTLKIGLIAPVTGPFAKVGDDISKGFKLYVSDSQNLLGLYTLDLTMIDEGNSAADATQAAQGLIKSGVVAIAGIASPAALTAIIPAAQAAKIPVLSAYAAPVNVNAGEYIWRCASVQGEAGEASAAFAQHEGRKAYVLTDGGAVANAEVDGFTTAFTAQGGSIAGTSNGTDGFDSRLSEAVNAAADVIFAAHTGDAAAALLTAYRSAGIATKLVGPASLTESIDLTKLSPIPDHVLTAGFYAPDLANAENQRFVASFHNTHGVPPSSTAAAAYDTAGLLDRAIGLIQGDVSGSKLNDAMKILGQINSPRGTWTFNTSRSPQQTWYLRQLKFDGQVASNLHDSDLAVLT
jgi:branched-chain amino acid transport system substrate-binding protein